ncbi:unnamed protein product [Alternaria alternata]
MEGRKTSEKARDSPIVVRHTPKKTNQPPMKLEVGQGAFYFSIELPPSKITSKRSGTTSKSGTPKGEETPTRTRTPSPLKNASPTRRRRSRYAHKDDTQPAEAKGNDPPEPSKTFVWYTNEDDAQAKPGSANSHSKNAQSTKDVQLKKDLCFGTNLRQLNHKKTEASRLNAYRLDFRRKPRHLQSQKIRWPGLIILEPRHKNCNLPFHYVKLIRDPRPIRQGPTGHRKPRRRGHTRDSQSEPSSGTSSLQAVQADGEKGIEETRQRHEEYQVRHAYPGGDLVGATPALAKDDCVAAAKRKDSQSKGADKTVAAGRARPRAGSAVSSNDEVRQMHMLVGKTL